jgi:aspartyl aminopeptidase
MNILGAHIDSPRLDVKQNPVFEDGGLCYLDTHYYGGIKKYQYVTLPLAIHGVVVKKSGETVIVNIGEEEDDPVFFISDLLPHLAQDQMKKNASAFIDGEALDLVIGNKPVIIDHDTKAGSKDKKPSEKDAVTKALMQTISELYGIEEEDFISAELEIVPAGKARDAGFDRSMVLAYGQDDRVCAYPSFRAQMEVTDIARTSCTLLVDKEEIGSVGATGMRSRFFENTLAEVMELCGQYSELAMRRTLANSAMLSSDVSSAFDPAYSSAFEKKNCAYLGGGMVFNKFTGSRGKGGTSDASAELVAVLRRLFADNGVVWQMAELGKVDQGGGGTIAKYMANRNIDTIDAGTPVLSMHAPFEVTSKFDCYMTYKAVLTAYKG